MLTLKQSSGRCCIENFENVREKTKMSEIMSTKINVRNKPKMSEIMSEMFYRESVLNYLKKTGLLIYG